VFFKSVNNKSFLSRICRAIATFLNFYVSHGSATRYLRYGKNYYIYFVDNLLLFLIVKEFVKIG